MIEFISRGVMVLQITSALQTNPPSIVCGGRPIYAHGVGRYHRDVELRRRRWWPQARNHAQIGLGVVRPCDKLRDGNVSCVVLHERCRYLGVWRDGYITQHFLSTDTLFEVWPCMPSVNAQNIPQVGPDMCQE